MGGAPNRRTADIHPGSQHRAGRNAAKALSALRTRARRLLDADDDAAVIFTSGGTEGANLVVQGAEWDAIVTTAIEHHAVIYPARHCALKTGTRLIEVDPDGAGRVQPDTLRAALAQLAGARRGLVSIGYVNNEIGTVQDLRALAAVVDAASPPGTERRWWFHTDAVQAPGHVPRGALGLRTLGVDFLTLTGHKFHGPPGVGLLVARAPAASLLRRPIMWGGGQQGGLRPGTESVATAAALVDALGDALGPLLEARLQHCAAAAAHVWGTLAPFIAAGHVRPTGPPPGARDRAPHHISFCVRGADRRELVQRLDRDHGVLVSGGSACGEETPVPSHVLAAVGVAGDFIYGSVRVTLSHVTHLDDVRAVLCPALRTILQQSALTADG